MGRLYGREKFQPGKICGQIWILQGLFYFVLALSTMVATLFVGLPWQFASLLDAEEYTVQNAAGWCNIVSLFIASICMAYALPIIVERAKKSLDFSFTIYFLHFILSTLWYTIPSNGTWWIIHTCTFILTAALGEYLCLRKEMNDISVDDILFNNNRRRRGRLPTDEPSSSSPSSSSSSSTLVSSSTTGSTIDISIHNSNNNNNNIAMDSFTRGVFNSSSSSSSLTTAATQLRSSSGTTNSTVNYSLVPNRDDYQSSSLQSSSTSLPVDPSSALRSPATIIIDHNTNSNNNSVSNSFVTTNYGGGKLRRSANVNNDFGNGNSSFSASSVAISTAESTVPFSTPRGKSKIKNDGNLLNNVFDSIVNVMNFSTTSTAATGNNSNDTISGSNGNNNNG